MSTIEDTALLFAGNAIKGASTAAVKTFIDNKITPLLRGSTTRKTELQIKKNLSKYTRFLENYTKYTASIIKCSEPYLLEDIYEPATISSSNSEIKYEISSFPKKLLSKSRCTLITDSAGMGKSTVAKFIARRAIIEIEAIPIFIELRRVRQDQGILNSIYKEISNSKPGETTSQELHQTLKNGGFLFILDGFDETDEEARSSIVHEINIMAAEFQYCHFIVTTRPEYAETLFPEFNKFNLNKLTKEQAYSIIKRLDQDRDQHKILINKITSASVDNFLGTPLLVTLLYGAFDFRPTIPPKKTAFFRQVYDALFEDHDLSKGDAYDRKKECNLDKEDFHKLMRSIGFESFKSKRDSYTITELQELVDRSISRSRFNHIDNKKVIKDIVKSVPLLNKDGNDYKWCHGSLKEYFAAQYITSDMGEKKVTMIETLFGSKEALKYKEIINLLSETDLDTLYEKCAYPLLKTNRDKYEDELDFQCGMIADSVNMLYFKIPQEIKLPYNSEVMIRLVNEIFSIDLSSTHSTWIANRRTRTALVSMLTDIGKKYILLSSIDRKRFPAYRRDPGRRSAALTAWHETFADVNISTENDKNKIMELAGKLGGIDNLIEVACIIPPSTASCVEVFNKVTKIRESESENEFSEF